MDPDTTMDTELTLQDIILAPLSSLELQGMVRKVSESSRFEINIGLDAKNLALHFNPRFESSLLTIAINSRKQGNWEAEDRTIDFPFQKSDNFKVIVYFDGAEFNIVSQDCHHVKFPNRSGLHLFNYINVKGNIDLHLLKLTN